MQQYVLVTIILCFWICMLMRLSAIRGWCPLLCAYYYNHQWQDCQRFDRRPGLLRLVHKNIQLLIEKKNLTVPGMSIRWPWLLPWTFQLFCFRGCWCAHRCMVLWWRSCRFAHHDVLHPHSHPYKRCSAINDIVNNDDVIISCVFDLKFVRVTCFVNVQCGRCIEVDFAVYNAWRQSQPTFAGVLEHRRYWVGCCALIDDVWIEIREVNYNIDHDSSFVCCMREEKMVSGVLSEYAGFFKVSGADTVHCVQRYP